MPVTGMIPVTDAMFSTAAVTIIRVRPPATNRAYASRNDSAIRMPA